MTHENPRSHRFVRAVWTALEAQGCTSVRTRARFLGISTTTVQRWQRVLDGDGAIGRPRDSVLTKLDVVFNTPRGHHADLWQRLTTPDDEDLPETEVQQLRRELAELTARVADLEDALDLLRRERRRG